MVVSALRVETFTGVPVAGILNRNLEPRLNLMMTFKLFTYGVLTHPTLLESLTGRSFTITSARLPDYQCYTLSQEGWPPIPAIVPESGASVSGALIHDFDEVLSELLDDFEDVDLGLYVKGSALVIDTQGDEHHATVYVAGPVGVDSLDGPWDAEAFIAQHYDDYLNRIIPEFLQRWR